MTDSPLAEGSVEAAFFDLDNTVIAKAAMAAFGGPLHDGGLLTKRSILRAVLSRLVYLHLGAGDRRLSRMSDVLLKVAKGWERSRVSAIVEETLERVVEPIIFAEAMDLIELHHKEGRIVVIVSASPEEVVVPLGRHLGVDATIASRAEVDEEDRYTGAMAFSAFGPYKAEAIRELAEQRGIDLERSFAYSDSYTDVPMLEAVGHPVAVNADRVLASLARDRGWESLRFVQPVRLRDRVRGHVPMPSRPATAISLGAVVIAVIAIGVGWYLGARRARRGPSS